MSAYNVKMIQHPNGEVQVRRYSTPLERKEPNEYEEDIHIGHGLDPFTLCSYKVVDDFDELPEPTHATKEENAIRSFNRTKQKIYGYARCVIWEMFITITFNPEIVNRYDYDECCRLARQWLHNQRRNAPNLQYLLVPELHQDGAIHFHGLLANVGKIKFKDSGKRTKDNAIIYNLSSWSKGFTTATTVSNLHAVSKYISKYITKELCAISSGKQRYFVSQNLPEPTTTTFIVDSEEDFEELLNTINASLGTETVHVSKPRKKNAFVDVDYYELQERNDNDTTTSF